jgi:hypothetical protein
MLYCSYVTLVTNGNVSNDLKEYLNNQRIDIYKIKTANPDLYELIKSKFEIIFQNLNIGHVENEIEEFFNDKLNVTKAGFDSLYHALKREARELYTNV